MKRILLGGTVVAVVLVIFFAAWETMGDHPIRPAALAAGPTSIESPNGLYRIDVTDTGILLISPSVQVKVESGQVKVQAPLVRLCGAGGRPVARQGDIVQTSGDMNHQVGPITQGSPTTYVC